MMHDSLNFILQTSREKCGVGQSKKKLSGLSECLSLVSGQVSLQKS